MTTAEAVQELRECGWHSVADDIEEGVPAHVVIDRLYEIGEGDSDAKEIVGSIHDQ